MLVLRQQKGRDRGGEWGHLQGDMHMVAVRLGFETSWLVPSGPPPALLAWTSLENTILTL